MEFRLYKKAEKGDEGIENEVRRRREASVAVREQREGEQKGKKMT